MERLFSSALRKKDVCGRQSMWRCWKPARCKKLGQHCMNEQCQDCGVFFPPPNSPRGKVQRVDLFSLGLTKRGRGLRVCARGDAGGMPAFRCPKPARSFQSLSFHAGLWGPAGPIHPFLDGPPSRLPPWPPSSPSVLFAAPATSTVNLWDFVLAVPTWNAPLPAICLASVPGSW